METANQNNTIENKTGEGNIEFLLFLNKAGKPCIRVKDLDAEEVIAVHIFPTIEMAKAEFKKAF